MARSSLLPSPIHSFVQWLRLKNYQYEVTFSLYMLTPTEKLVFNFILLSLLSMLIAAAYIYLPDHLASIYGRIQYYVSGDGSLISEYLPSASPILREAATKSLDLVLETPQVAPPAKLGEL